MGHHKLSVTIPANIYIDLKKYIAQNNIRMSHLVTEAIIEKLKKINEELYIKSINEAFKDEEAIEEQLKMANSIADNTDIEELPW